MKKRTKKTKAQAVGKSVVGDQPAAAALSGPVPGSPAKFLRAVVQICDTPRNRAAMDNLHAEVRRVLGGVDGPIGVIKFETCEIQSLAKLRAKENNQAE
jgi:hypothetical protein